MNVAMSREVAAWVRESEPVALTVETVAKRVVHMNDDLVSLGDKALLDPTVRPLGLEYALWMFQESFHIEVLPQGELAVSQAYRVLKDRLRRYLPVVVGTDPVWVGLFGASGAQLWFELLLERFVNSQREDRVPVDGWHESMFGTGSVDIALEVGDGSPVRFQVRVHGDGGQGQVVTLAALDVSTELRADLLAANWSLSGPVVFCEFSDCDAAASALASALRQSTRSGVAPRKVTVSVSGGATIEEAMRGHGSPGRKVRLTVDAAESPVVWPGSDLEILSTLCPSSSPEYSCSERGVLTEPAQVWASGERLAQVRAAGFAVEVDGPEDRSGDMSATVFPRSTRTLVV